MPYKEHCPALWARVLRSALDPSFHETKIAEYMIAALDIVYLHEVVNLRVVVNADFACLFGVLGIRFELVCDEDLAAIRGFSTSAQGLLTDI
jgi:hypothetical protein